MYTLLTPELRDEYYDQIRPTRDVILGRTRSQTTYFAVNSLGLTPRLWQYYFWKVLDSGKKRIIAVTGRQMGKSVGVATFALRCALFNTHPVGITRTTVIGIISSSEEQSKKLMLEIRKLILKADYHVETVTSGAKDPGRWKKFYSKQIDDSVDATNTKSTITFRNGCSIKCLPPTPRIRGESFSIVLVDEAAHITDSSIFYEYIEPTVSNTKGNIILTSTPNGSTGWFAELFDLENLKENNPYERVWFSYKDVEDLDYIRDMESKKQDMFLNGRQREWEQEYEARFVSMSKSFIGSDEFDGIINPELTKVDEWKLPCDLGIDFGMVHSRTVLNISGVVNKKSRLLYDYEYLPEADHSLVEDCVSLKSRFNIQRAIVDDCPQAHYIIPKLKEHFQVILMSFRAEKIQKYVTLKSKILQKKIEIYRCTPLITQFKGLIVEEGLQTTRIHKGPGNRDDYPDSWLLSNYFFLSNDSDEFSSELAGVSPVIPSHKGVRYDSLYANPLLEHQILYKELLEEMELWK
jgi:hypothetical protein